METWHDIIGDILASMINISGNINDRVFKRLVDDVYDLLMEGDYDPDRGFKELEICEAIDEVVGNIIEMQYDSEITIN